MLAVNGPWGSGKTTAVNMIVEALGDLQKDAPSGREIVPIRFNPWWFSEQEDLVKAFFAELSGSLDKKRLRECRRGVPQGCAPRGIVKGPRGRGSRADPRRRCW